MADGLLSAKAPPGDFAVDVVTAGRELEIFLDMMSAYATDNHSYLLAAAYNKGVSEDETSLRSRLLELLPVRTEVQTPVKCGALSTRHFGTWDGTPVPSRTLAIRGAGNKNRAGAVAGDFRGLRPHP